MKSLSGPMSFPYTGSTDLGRYLRVKRSGSTVALAAAVDKGIGTLTQRVIGVPTSGAMPMGAGSGASVLLNNDDGTRLAIASGAITAGADVFDDADGKYGANAIGRYAGWAVTAASADGDIFELCTDPRDKTKPVEAKTADYTVTYADRGKTLSTEGAAGTVVFALPVAVICEPPARFNFHVGATQELRIDPNGTETIALPSTGAQGAAGKYLTANAQGENVAIVCRKAGQWDVESYIGTWTAEA